jgi:hypothetical protein
MRRNLTGLDVTNPEKRVCNVRRSTHCHLSSLNSSFARRWRTMSESESTVRAPSPTGIPVSAPSQPAAAPPPVPTILYSWRKVHPGARCHYIRHHEEANNALHNLNSGVYGFDLEWKPTFKRGQRENPVSLVQIANHEVILLLQITAMQGETLDHQTSLRPLLISPLQNFHQGCVNFSTTRNSQRLELEYKVR